MYLKLPCFFFFLVIIEINAVHGSNVTVFNDLKIIGSIISKIGLSIEKQKAENYSNPEKILFAEKVDVSTLHDEIRSAKCVLMWKEDDHNRTLLNVTVNCTELVRNISWNQETSNAKEGDHSTWLIGALSMLLLVILIQFSWLLRHHRTRKDNDGSDTLPRITNDQIAWIRLLGSGHYGEVWLGKLKLETGESTCVAMKQPRNAKAREYLLEEAILLSNLGKKGTMINEKIVNVKGICMHSHHLISDKNEKVAAIRDSKYHPVLLFEYLNGGNCQTYFIEHHKKIKVTELRKIAVDIIDACIFLENEHYIHRDIALRNILLQINQFPLNIVMAKLADFGLAKDVSGETHRYDSSTSPFPDRSTAPEGLLGGEFTIKSDVWSYGVLLWEMFTMWETGAQAVPYSDHQHFSMLQYHICDQRGKLAKPCFCPQDIYDHVLKPCWAYDPSDRPSFYDLKEMLLEVWQEINEPILMPKRSRMPSPMKLSHRSNLSLHKNSSIYNRISHANKVAIKKKSQKVNIGISFGRRKKTNSGSTISQNDLEPYLNLSDIDECNYNRNGQSNEGVINSNYANSDSDNNIPSISGKPESSVADINEYYCSRNEQFNEDTNNLNYANCDNFNKIPSKSRKRKHKLQNIGVSNVAYTSNEIESRHNCCIHSPSPSTRKESEITECNHSSTFSHSIRPQLGSINTSFSFSDAQRKIDGIQINGTITSNDQQVRFGMSSWMVNEEAPGNTARDNVL